MALDTFDNLVKEIINWSHRDDLGNKIYSFILIAENNMYSNSVANLKVRSIETITTQLTTSNLISLPANFEKARSIRLIVNSGGELKSKSPGQLQRRSGTGRPLFYSIIGDQIEFDVTPDQSYTIEIQYYKRATKLSVANQTNEILINHPSIYLFGALAVLFKYTQNIEQEISYGGQFIDSIKGANKADKKRRHLAPAVQLPQGIV